MTKSTWTDSSDRHLLLAMCISNGASSKPSPKWEVVETIMRRWGYNFTASAMYQHFNKKIWKEASDAAPVNVVNGSATSATSASATSSKKRKAAPKTNKTAKGKVGVDVDSDSSDESTPIPTKRRRTVTPKKTVAASEAAPPASAVDSDEDDLSMFNEFIKTEVKEEPEEETATGGDDRARSLTLA